MPQKTAATAPSPQGSAIAAALAEALARSGTRCVVCSRPDVAAVVREWVAALAGKRVGFQVERLSPAIEADFGFYVSRETLAKHIRRCEPELAAKTSYR